MTGYKTRDTARSFQAYSKAIEDIEASNEIVRKRLDEGRAKRPNSMRNLIFMNNLQVVKIMYCRGDSLVDLREPVLQSLTGALREEKQDIVEAVYVDLVDFASLAVLLKMPESTFRDLKKIVDRCDRRDQVLDHLISYGTEYQTGEAGQSALMIRTNLDLAIECCMQTQGGGGCAKHLLDFMKTEWHKRQTNSSDLKNQLKPDMPYRGIYCFKVAAIAFINKLDDTDLRQSEYYPADIVDFARTS